MEFAAQVSQFIKIDPIRMETDLAFIYLDLIGERNKPIKRTNDEKGCLVVEKEDNILMKLSPCLSSIGLFRYVADKYYMLGN